MSSGLSTLLGRIWDAASGRPVEARVCVVASDGRICTPPDALLTPGATAGPSHDPTAGYPFFYSEGTFLVEAPSGPAQVIVERGTEYRQLVQAIDLPSDGRVDVDLTMKRWVRMPEEGWYAGNTHVHYTAAESRPEERLRLDPRVEDLPVLIVSILQRRDEYPASNVFPIGIHRLSDPEHIIDIGEESRHNSEPWEIGLGHIMLINLRELVTPVSRGILVDDSNPDFPPLVDACDSAHADGAVVLWCHNGRGMEAPVAAILGRLDAMNIFDPYWMDPEYAIWYRLLNCGLRLPISTGSDWYICSSNRVYADVGADFNYGTWLTALKAGRTFATNGPILHLDVEGHSPSNEQIELGPARRRARVTITWRSALPIDVVEVVRDGEVVTLHEEPDGSLAGSLTADVDVEGAGWLAARASGARRTSFGHALWSHTSPVYLRAGPNRQSAALAAEFFGDQLTESERWLATKAQFADAGQRARMTQLFADARGEFRRLL